MAGGKCYAQPVDSNYTFVIHSRGTTWFLRIKNAARRERDKLTLHTTMGDALWMAALVHNHLMTPEQAYRYIFVQNKKRGI